MIPEKWVQHSEQDYARGLNHLLPLGRAWPRTATSVLQKVISGLTKIWGYWFEALSASLLTTESDPGKTVILLPEWERAFGLPDKCLTEPTSLFNRRVALLQRMTMLGAQSRQFFIDAAMRIGYSITIEEFSPFMAGMSRCGDTRDISPSDGVHYRWEIGGPEMRFYWRIKVSTLRVTWFRAASGMAGVDPMVRIGLATDLECLLRRWKPAHTEIIFDYSDASTSIFEDR